MTTGCQVTGAGPASPTRSIVTIQRSIIHFLRKDRQGSYEPRNLYPTKLSRNEPGKFFNGTRFFLRPQLFV